VPRVDGVLNPTTSVVLSFPIDFAIPVFINIGYLAFKPRLYIPRPLRCHRCQLFGHGVVNCKKASDLCPRCAEQHDYEYCPNKKEIPKCSNCGGAHSAGYSKCPTYTQAQVMTKVVVTNGMSYRDAVRQVRTAPLVAATGSPVLIDMSAVAQPRPAPRLAPRLSRGVSAPPSPLPVIQPAPKPIILSTTIETQTEVFIETTVTFPDVVQFINALIKAILVGSADKEVCIKAVTEACLHLF